MIKELMSFINKMIQNSRYHNKNMKIKHQFSISMFLNIILVVDL